MSSSQLLQNCPQFSELLNRARAGAPITVVVAGAEDEDLLIGLSDVVERQLADLVLVGKERRLAELCVEVGLTDVNIVDADDDDVASEAVRVVKRTDTAVLMKGMISSGPLLRAVLDREHGLRGDNLLSHVAIYDGPNCPRLWLMTDGGLNVAPDLEQKKAIAANVVSLAHSLDIQTPKVAMISATETADRSVPSSIDAYKLAECGQRGEFGQCICDGPLALDVALSSDAAAKKGRTSEVSGEADVFLVPSIECGNILGKSMMYMAGATMAGLVVGANAPIVLNSRADSRAGRLASVIVASCLAQKE